MNQLQLLTFSFRIFTISTMTSTITPRTHTNMMATITKLKLSLPATSITHQVEQPVILIPKESEIGAWSKHVCTSTSHNEFRTTFVTEQLKIGTSSSNYNKTFTMRLTLLYTTVILSVESAIQNSKRSVSIAIWNNGTEWQLQALHHCQLQLFIFEVLRFV